MDYKKEGIIFIGQVIFLLIFTLLLKDVLAALVVSFFTRPLIKMMWSWIEKNKEKRQQ